MEIDPSIDPKYLFGGGPVMDTEYTDAKAVWEKLQVAGVWADAEPEGAVKAPLPIEVLAELRYAFADSDWAALVTRDTDNDGAPCFRLWYQRGDRFQRSGIFTDGGRLAAYIRQAAHDKFKDYRPVIDTLDKLKFKHALSVVPECYRVHARTAKCAKCPYNEECFAVDPTNAQAEVVEEPEEAFLWRLKRKVAAQWGGDAPGPEPELSPLQKTALEPPPGRECGVCAGAGEVLITDAQTGHTSRLKCRACGGNGWEES